MRWLIMALVIGLMQLLNYGLALGVQWLWRPVYAVPTKWVMVGCFLFSNALILLMFVGVFRWSIGWLATLWLGAMGAVLGMGLIFVLHKAGVQSAWVDRAVALAGIVAMVGVAVYNAYTPVVRHLTLQIDKPMPTPVRLAVASDLHLGKMVGVRELGLLETLLKENQVDVLLIPGDVMDDDTVYFEKMAMAEPFKKALNAPAFGSVVTLGNHDLYRTGAYNAINQAIKDTGAVLLQDGTATLVVKKDGKQTQLELVGRFDDHHRDRLPTANLLEKVDTTHPVILLDHRPSQIDEHSTLPIDLQVSGHTHKGQVFPANFIVDRLNRVGYGHQQINNTHFVVSSGLGFWGVPFRIGSQAEIWVIELRGK